jgi:hypothetical protein
MGNAINHVTERIAVRDDRPVRGVDKLLGLCPRGDRISCPLSLFKLGLIFLPQFSHDAASLGLDFSLSFGCTIAHLADVLAPGHLPLDEGQ